MKCESRGPLRTGAMGVSVTAERLKLNVDTAHRIEGLQEHLSEPSYAASCARFHEKAQADRRQQWHAYHTNLAELHARLSQEHADKAEALLNVPEGGHKHG